MMEQLSMFDYKETMSPLASRLRPESLETFVGQKHLLGEGKLLRQLIDQDQIPSMIFWGPPGVGKTTLASIIAKKTHADFVNFSAVTSGIKEIKEVMARAELSRGPGSGPWSLWTRSTASIRPSRTPFSLMWKRAASSSSEPPRKTRPLRSTQLFYPDAAFSSSSLFPPTT